MHQGSVDFDRVAKTSGIRVLRTPIRAPKANAVCERFLGSERRECLDHVLIFSERHLHLVLGEYVAFFNRVRPHQGIGQRIIYWQAKEIFRAIREADPERNGIKLALLRHVRPIEWENVVVYGEYRLDRRRIRGR